MPSDKTHRKSYQYSEGFTLIEVLIAMIILGVAIIGWMNAKQSAVLNRGQSRTMTVAAELSQAQIEEVSVNPSQYFAAFCADKDPDSETCTHSASHNSGGFEYSISWELEKIPTFVQDSRDFWQIIVNVNWNYRGNKSFSSKRIIMQRPL